MFTEGQLVYVGKDRKPCDHVRSVRQWAMPNYELVYSEELDEEFAVSTDEVFTTPE
jgi:hypothetical protein